jgi:hypothetical protein
MPYAPPRICAGCRRPTNGQCRECERKRQQRSDENRPNSTDRGYDAEYRRVRLIALERDNWTCRDCGWQPDIVRMMGRSGSLAAPTEAVMMELAERARQRLRILHVDHITPIAEAPQLRLDTRNMQTLCDSCHRRKTMRENGMAGRG